MSYDIFRYIFIGGLVLAILMLIVTVLLFILLDIRTVIGTLTGSKARKGVENIKIKSSENASRRKSSIAGKVTSGNSGGLSPTSKISPQDRYDALDASQTSVLNGDGGAQTTVLSGDNSSQTTVLSSEGGSQTTVLSGGSAQEPQRHGSAYGGTGTVDPYFAVEVDITYVHAGEVIR